MVSRFNVALIPPNSQREMQVLASPYKTLIFEPPFSNKIQNLQCGNEQHKS